MSQFLAALFWFGFGLVTAVASVDYGLGSLPEPGPGLTPFLLGLLLGLATLPLVIKGARIWAQDRPAGRRPPSPLAGGDLKKVGLALAAMVGFALALTKLGFLLCSFLTMAVLFALINAFRWRGVILASALSSGGCWVLFRWLLKVDLPRGWWGLG
jgi:hypothetical protein